MSTQRINITFPKDLLNRLDKIVPNGARSMFIARVISEKLNTKDARKKAFEEGLRMNYGYYKKEGKIWDATVADGLKEWPWKK